MSDQPIKFSTYKNANNSPNIEINTPPSEEIHFSSKNPVQNVNDGREIKFRTSNASRLPRKTADIASAPNTSTPTRNIVNPADIVGPPKDDQVNIVTKLLSDTDDAIARKQKEFNDFMDALEEEDAINRSLLTEEQIAAEVKELDEDATTNNEYDEEDILVENESFETNTEYVIKPRTKKEEPIIENNIIKNDNIHYKKSKSIFAEEDNKEENTTSILKSVINNITEEERKEGKERTIMMSASPEEKAAFIKNKKLEEQGEMTMENERRNIFAEENTTEMSSVNSTNTVEENENTTMEEKPMKLKDPFKAEPLADAPASVDAFSNIDDEDFKELEDDEEGNDNILEDENMKALQKEIANKIKPVNEALDISSFTIAEKAVSFSNILNAEKEETRVTDWVLMGSNRHIAFTAFTGTQLEKINPSNGGRNRFQSIKTQWQEIYDHVVDPYKPATLEAWLKTIRYTDIDNIYMGIYVSNFMDANFIPYSCPNCKNMFLSDNLKITDMVKYKDDDVKKKFQALYDAECTPISSTTTIAEVVPVSDKIAVALKNPSIYDVLFETASLDEAFTTKYEQILALIVYIDKIYYIDKTTKTLVPVNVKVYPNNLTKSVKSKVITFSKILQSLTSDQYSIIQAYIRNLVETNSEITYSIPEATCPQCNTTIPEEERRAQEILFTRHQLGALATM